MTRAELFGSKSSGRLTSVFAMVAICAFLGACAATQDPQSSTPSRDTEPAASTAELPASDPPASTASVIGTTEIVDEAPPGAIEIAVRSDAARYEPAVLTAPAGSIEFFIRNEGTGSVGDESHNLQIGTESPPSEPIVGSTNVDPDQAVVFAVSGLLPGTYIFWCTVRPRIGDRAPHFTVGMVGVLTVTP